MVGNDFGDISRLFRDTHTAAANKAGSIWGKAGKLAFGVAATAGTVALYGAFAPEPVISKAAAGTAALVMGGAIVVGLGSYAMEKIWDSIGQVSQKDELSQNTIQK